MRFSLKNRICAALLCCCMLFMTGCFACHSILGVDNDEYFDVDSNLSLDVVMNNQDSAVSGEYPGGRRAFVFNNCTYEADISDFRLIDIIGNVSVYYYTGITVLNDDEVGTDSDLKSNSESDSEYNLVNKKGYYDKSRAKLKYFWTIAAYNFVTEEYMEIMTKEYNPVNDAGKMNGNPAVVYKTDLYGVYSINVGYFFINFVLYRNDYMEFISSGVAPDPNSDCKDYGYPDYSIWKLSSDNKKKIREALGIKGDNNNFCCTDYAVKNKTEEKYCATFMTLPTDDDFNQKNVMFEVELKSEVVDNETQRTIILRKKENSVLTVSGGNILSSNAASGNCVYVLSQGTKKIKFGIDNRDRRTRFSIELEDPGKDAKKRENNVLQSFSVKDYTDTDDNGNESVSDQESRLELVFKNRIEYYKIERYTVFGVIEYRAVYLKTYWLNEFCSTYLSSDDIPSILDFPWGVNISSTTDGFRNIFESGETNWSSTSGAAYCSFGYGGKTLVVGFDGYTFDKTVRYFDEEGNETRVSKSKSEFTLAQLPFATVRIV